MERKIVIRKSTHLVDKIKQYTKPIALAALVLSIPLTVYVLNQVQDIRQRAAGELVPITSNFPQACSWSTNFKDISSQTYSTAVKCLNQTYCVVAGYDAKSMPSDLTFPSVGGDKPTTRKYALAFIARYRAKVIPAGNSRHWNMVSPTGIYKDLGPGQDLAAEVETATMNGFVQGATCGDYYTSQELTANGWKAGDRCFDPDGDWGFGFSAGYIDSTNSTKTPVTPTITRGAFLEALYKYGIDTAHQDLKMCMIATSTPPVPPTVPPAIACNTSCVVGSNTCAQASNGCTYCKPAASVPQTDVSKLTGCSVPNFTRQFIDIADKTYKVPVECMNKSYCVTVGFDQDTCNKKPGTCLPFTDGQGFFGGEIKTSRKFAVAFIARYHVDVKGDWQWVVPTGNVFSDVKPADEALAREIETSAKYGFIVGNGGEFDPEGDWIYGFHGINRSDYFATGGTPLVTANASTTITRGAFIQALYNYGTSPSNPELTKCMTSTNTGSAGSCQPPPACNSTCSNNADCTGAQNGCTVCGSGGKCQPAPSCNATCSNNADCAGAQDGCTVCGSAGKCQPAPACNVSCTKDGDCTGAKDGCTVCKGATTAAAGKCAPAPSCNSTCTNNADCAGGQSGCSVCNSGGKCSPPPACGVSCGNNSDCSTAANGCNTCNSVTGKCSVAACNTSCSRDSDCAGAATKDGCTSCLGGKCQLPFNAGACKCDGIEATTIGTGQKVTFTAYSKVEGTDVLSAAVKGVNMRVFRGGTTIQNQIAASGFITPTIVTNTASLVRYQTKWDYTVPADANNGDFFRVQADMNCVPKSLAIVPNYNNDKGIIAKIIDKITEPIRAVLGAAVTPTPGKAIQISSFYPGEITQRDSCYLQFTIKR